MNIVHCSSARSDSKLRTLPEAVFSPRENPLSVPADSIATAESSFWINSAAICSLDASDLFAEAAAGTQKAAKGVLSFTFCVPNAAIFPLDAANGTLFNAFIILKASNGIPFVPISSGKEAIGMPVAPISSGKGAMAPAKAAT
ncbi:MAG TPA: hypothetical protein VGO45_09380 [Bacteroidia bacterium]|nr:hypothetical protein [Bacteroidia bacterium]